LWKTASAPDTGRQPTLWTRKRLVLAIGLIFVAGIVAAALDLRFVIGGSPRRVEPNSVLVLDPRTMATVRNVAGGQLPSGSRFARGAGLLWTVNGATNELVAIEPQTRRVARRWKVGNDPIAVTIGYGAAWVASAGNATVTRVPLTGGKPEAIGLNDPPSAIAAGANDVWVASSRGKTVIRIDPKTKETTKTIRLANPPERVAVVRGRVWLAIGE
jgi:hypothetical protein